MKITRIITKLALSGIAIFSLLFVTENAFAGDYGLSETANQAGLSQYGNSVPKIAGSIIGTALSMISVIFFILMVYGGFLWMTAHGDEGQVTKAQETIIAAVIGIVVILASYAITNFITTSVTTNGGDNNPNGGATCDSNLVGDACNAVSGCTYYQEAVSGVTTCVKSSTVTKCESAQNTCEGNAAACTEAFAQCILAG